MKRIFLIFSFSLLFPLFTSATLEQNSFFEDNSESISSIIAPMMTLFAAVEAHEYTDFQDAPIMYIGVLSGIVTFYISNRMLKKLGRYLNDNQREIHGNHKKILTTDKT